MGLRNFEKFFDHFVKNDACSLVQSEERPMLAKSSTMGYVWKSVPFWSSLGKTSKFEWEWDLNWDDLLVTHTVDRSLFQFGLAQFLIKKTPPWFKEKQITHRIYFYCALRYFQIPSHKAVMPNHTKP